MVSFFAFLHHLAAFTLVSALAVEFTLIRTDLTAAASRRLVVTDAVYGAAAGMVLVVGFLRVFYFEKGASYYLHSVPFIAKLCLFGAVALLSVYPKLEFMSWRASQEQGLAPAVPPAKVRTMRRIMHWELAGVVLILLCAALMARGIGYVGA